MQITKNFNLMTDRALSCPCCNRFNARMKSMERLQSLRDDLGQPVIITSGSRCKSHNAVVRGASNSQHLIDIDEGIESRGFDIAASSSAYRLALIASAIKVGFTGIGIGKDFIHLDDRDSTAVMWTYYK